MKDTIIFPVSFLLNVPFFSNQLSRPEPHTALFELGCVIPNDNRLWLVAGDYMDKTRDGIFVAAPKDIAEYVGACAAELAKMARAGHLVALTYILDMATMEAHQALRRAEIEERRAA